MRDTDPPAEPFRPLGHPEPKPSPPKPEWRKTETPGIETDKDGHLRTNIPVKQAKLPSVFDWWMHMGQQ